MHQTVMNQHLSVQSFHEVSVLFCAVSVWLMMALFAWSVWLAARDGIKRLRMLHQIPCSQCQYFTQQYCLKCTVHPITAFSEAAIACPDYCAIATTTTLYQGASQTPIGDQLKNCYSSLRSP